MDKQKTANDIIDAALPIVAFEGWNQHSLHQAAVNAGYKKTDAIRVFPGGEVVPSIGISGAMTLQC